MNRSAFLMSLVVLAVVSVLSARVSFAAEQAPAEQERNKAVARRVFDEIFNQGKFEVADEIYAPDFVNHGLHRNAGLHEDQDAVHQEKAAFPDLKITVDQMVAEGDLVSVVWTFRGTHTHGGYGGLPPTGAAIEFRGMTVWRIVDGRIRDEWTVFDDMRAYGQVLDHLKWPLAGLLCAVVVLGWWTVRVFRRRGPASGKS